jgi:hypothetical protein
LLTPGYGKRRGLGPGGGVLKLGGRGFRRTVGEVEGGRVPVAGEIGGVGEADGRVLGRLARHGDGAGGHLGDGVGLRVGGGDDGLPGADEDPEADVDAFGALGMFEAALEDVDREGRAVDRERVGGIGPGAARGGEKLVGEGGEIGGHKGLPEVACRT